MAELEELLLGELALGLALEPDAALPDVLPELALSFFSSIGPDGALLGEAGAVLGEAGEVVEPAEDLVEPGEAARSPVRSQAVTSTVPRATETASATDVNLMKTSMVGVPV